MIFESGFLGTSAPLYLDIVTVYFAFLPLLLGGSVFLAVKKQLEAHYRSQIVIFIITVVMVLVFEIGVRLDGGFVAYAQGSTLSMAFLSIFLGVHIAIAVISVILWVITLYTSLREYHSTMDSVEFADRHKKKTYLLFAGLTVTSIMGVMIYLFLFLW